jgi:putative transcription factor
MQCEMCGSDAEELFKVDVEGAKLNICKKCSKFGKVIERVKAPVFVSPKEAEKRRAEVAPKQIETETIFVIVQDYPTRVKNAREHLGMKQEDLGKKINERDTLIHKVETGAIEPNIPLARKLEKFLNIKLVEEHQEDKSLVPASKKGDITLGDFARIKKR